MSQHSMRARGGHAGGRNEQRRNFGGNLPNQDPDNRDHPEEEADPPEDAPPEVLRQALREAQVARNEHRQANVEKDREISKLQDQVGRKQARAERFQEKTPQDSKYAAAGKRCALMRQLWLPTGIHDVECDPTYSPELRYDKAHPEMRLQGEKADILESMASIFREDFLKLEHFQYKFDKAHGEQRRNSASRVRNNASLIYGCEQAQVTCSTEARGANPKFREFLGYKTDVNLKTSERYPALAPVLYKDLRGGTNANIRLFRHDFVLRTFSAIAFGIGSLHEPQTGTAQGQPILARVLGLRAITPAAIAAAAVLTRWCISPDEKFTEEGDNTGIKWFEDYRVYKQLIVEGIRKEEKRVARGLSGGPFLKLMSEWNKRFFPNSGGQDANGDRDGGASDRSDVAGALAEIDEFADGDEDLEE
ncbi:unnamed protein product [Rhizoctonia solani]|uniref:Uncharacterized protein n=1 Tax=Rhizoctonia solani TaxID=456999 RepID=A0A8H3ACV6_9AGAM|nr:unnamed protein product [Rhizoctonia solani]